MVNWRSNTITMDQSLEHILESLEDYWRKIDFPLLSRLAPGIDPDGIEPRNFDGVLPEEVKVLYKWKNGIKPEFAREPIGRQTLFDGGIPMAMQKVWWMQDVRGGDDELWWSPSKIPIFESGGGELYLIDCDASTPEYGQIIFFNPGSVDFDLAISIYDSLLTLFQSVLQAYQGNLFQVGDKGYLDVSDYKKLNRLYTELNPKSGYWKLYNW